MARNLVGMEMVCFGKSEHVEIEYSGGGYVDEAGDSVDDLLDMNCYVCSASYYTREGDFIPYCPNCGHIDRKIFHERQALIDFLIGCDLSWTSRNGTTPVAVQTWDKGDWQLRFPANVMALEGSGNYKAVRKLS